MKKHRMTYFSASACAELLPSGLLLVALCGPLTGPALLHFRAEIVTAPYASQIRSFVADYTGAVLALSGADLDAVLDDGEESPSKLPAAMVAAPANFEVFAGHCRRMADLGILRQLFRSRGEALDWASLEADLL